DTKLTYTTIFRAPRRPLRAEGKENNEGSRITDERQWRKSVPILEERRRFDDLWLPSRRARACADHLLREGTGLRCALLMDEKSPRTTRDSCPFSTKPPAPLLFGSAHWPSPICHAVGPDFHR